MKNDLPSAAENDWSGSIPRNLPYRESYSVRDTDGSFMSFTGQTIEITFSRCGSAELSLSTADSTIVVETLTNDEGQSVPTFRPAAVDVSSLCGDYTGDIVMTDSDSVAHYWASGKITFTDQPA